MTFFAGLYLSEGIIYIVENFVAQHEIRIDWENTFPCGNFKSPTEKSFTAEVQLSRTISAFIQRV